jgi:hypothetical protein
MSDLLIINPYRMKTLEFELLPTEELHDIVSGVERLYSYLETKGMSVDVINYGISPSKSKNWRWLYKDGSKAPLRRRHFTQFKEIKNYNVVGFSIIDPALKEDYLFGKTLNELRTMTDSIFAI